ncbi:CoA pyrophosphatase [Corallincola spongiicola]|uniref:CoA pyrophosphatase n=1 Tax=Corallincola spongiicola TaxID=2520508 RepID=A0ABY1WV77_9GAMM|nr:CoA pyrophosphatase [Corallincola spongiicola]TAA48486.1 CoA pyrophosphatase [Corallincola spongiicola]
MKLEALLNRFLLHPPPPSQSYNGEIEAAVLVPLQLVDGQLQIVFTRRPDDIPHHPNQICFPGGKREPGDADLMATALRETEEELGISASTIKVLGVLPSRITRTGFFVQPFLGMLSHDQFSPDPIEVAELFSLPVSEILQPHAFHGETVAINNEQLEIFGSYSSNGLIWGMTAHILVDLIKQLNAPT